jgi:hypothetical protein
MIPLVRPFAFPKNKLLPSVLQATAGLRCGFKSGTIGSPRLTTVVRPRSSDRVRGRFLNKATRATKPAAAVGGMFRLSFN